MSQIKSHLKIQNSYVSFREESLERIASMSVDDALNTYLTISNMIINTHREVRQPTRSPNLSSNIRKFKKSR